MSELDPKQLYRDDCLHVGAKCGCFMRVSSGIAKNEFGGDRLILGWGACKEHDGTEACRLDFLAGVRSGLLVINEIHVIPGVGQAPEASTT